MAAKKQLSKAEAFFVESHWGRLPPAQIAEQLDLPVQKVEDYIQKLQEAGVQPTPQPSRTGPEKAGFAVTNGVTSMTQQASIISDETRGVTFDSVTRGEDPKPRERNNEVFKKRGGVHIIDPSRPVT